MKINDNDYCAKKINNMHKDEIEKIILICSKIISQIEINIMEIEDSDMQNKDYKNTIASLSGIVKLINQINAIDYLDEDEKNKNNDLNLKFYDKSDIEILKRAIYIYDEESELQISK